MTTHTIRLRDLAPKQRVALRHLAKGCTGREIAHALGMRYGSARVFLHFLYQDLGVRNKTEAAIWYVMKGAHDGP